jgi:hypothetical protein
MKIQDKDNRKGHFRVSLVKSGVRILAGVCLCLVDNTLANMAGVFLIIAEVLGIVEEMV